ncbi:MAG: hypothetical protein JST38_05490 [Bacteroidetes bacterium]|nr:hypothetical protein [Bacteroidota bacterium]MBS1940312.1 hypothetical protein [Bacteroidota bacterium]
MKITFLRTEHNGKKQQGGSKSAEISEVHGIKKGHVVLRRSKVGPTLPAALPKVDKGRGLSWVPSLSSGKHFSCRGPQLADERALHYDKQ